MLLPRPLTEKVDEQHILAKCCKCSNFGVFNLLKVPTSRITHSAIELDLLKQQKYAGHKKVSQNNLPSQKKSKFDSVEVTSDLLISKMLK